MSNTSVYEQLENLIFAMKLLKGRVKLLEESKDINMSDDWYESCDKIIKTITKSDFHVVKSPKRNN